MLAGVYGRLSEGNSDGDDSGQYCPPDSPDFGCDSVHFGTRDCPGRDVLALEQGIEGNRPLARVQINANQVTVITCKLARIEKSRIWLVPGRITPKGNWR